MTLPCRSAVVAVAVIATCTPAFVQPTIPTLAIVNGKVFTGIAAAPWAEALTIVGDRIGVVGTTASVRQLVGASTRVIDAGGRVVIPGINDAHVHVAARPPGVDLEGPPVVEQDPSLEEILQRVKAAVAKAPAGGWIYGDIGSRVLDDPRATRSAVDAVAAGHPVVLTAWTGHGTLFNTAALRQLQVRDDEPDPPGGFFVRLPGTRTVTGLAHEYAEYILRQRISMMPDEQAQEKALRDDAAAAVGLGITSVQLMATNRPAAQLARTAVVADLPIRVRVIDVPMTGMASWREPASASVRDSTRVTVSGAKWILDGTPVERLMLLREPYSDRPGTHGRRNFEVADISTFLKRALDRREQPIFHAVGDQAIDDVLTALEASGGQAWQPLRPRIEHGDMLEPAHFERAKKLGVTIVQNPSHFMLPAVMAPRLGTRTARLTMMKSMIAAGVPVALGSDGPFNPYLNVMFASINANNPAQAMTREQAVSAYTLGSARAEMMETQKGTLAPGMLADLAILSQDIFTAPPDTLPATVSVLTLVGGTVVHERKEDAAPVRARALLDKVPLVDGHNDLPMTLRETFASDLSRVDLRKRGATVDTDIPRLREGRVSGQFWSVFIPSGLPKPARTQLEQIELARRMIDAYPDTFLFATRAADVERARQQGKIASFLGMENGQAIENSLGALRAYYALGVRYMTLTHGKNNDWADSATDTPAHGGLTPFGREVVREMNRLGMLVDISHVSPDVMRQVLDISEAPVIFSHSSARAVVDHLRNVPDDVLARMAKNGGVVNVTFIPGFVSAATAAWGKDLERSIFNARTGAEMEKMEKDHAAAHGPAPPATLAQVADHIDHVARIAGHDHVGIGSDFWGSTDEPKGLEDVSRFPDLFAELIRRGWSDGDLEKLAGGNLLRALGAAEAAATRLAAQRPPSTATIDSLDGQKTP